MIALLVADAVVGLGTLLAAVGVVRFPEVMARMHALTKASTLGVVLVLLGGAVTLDHPYDVTSLLLAAALQVLTRPIGANLLSRATYRAGAEQEPVSE